MATAVPTKPRRGKPVNPLGAPKRSRFGWSDAWTLSDRIGLRIKLHDLHVLIAVVQAGSMNKAAAQLDTTQPAVSKSIKELERTVGVRLLERSAQGVVPTALGDAYSYAYRNVTRPDRPRTRRNGRSRASVQSPWRRSVHVGDRRESSTAARASARRSFDDCERA